MSTPSVAPASTPAPEDAVLILSRSDAESQEFATLLGNAGIHAVPFSDDAQFWNGARDGSAALLINVAVDQAIAGALRETLLNQPEWSDLRVAIIVESLDQKSTTAIESLIGLGSVTLLDQERAFSLLVPEMAAAVRSRKRQLHMRDRLSQSQLEQSHARMAESQLRELADKTAHRARVMEMCLLSTPDYIYAFDPDGRFLYTNHALPSAVDVPREDVAGKNFADLNIDPERAAKLTKQFQTVIETGQPLRGETVVTNIHGTRSYEYIFAPIFGAAGAVEAVAGSTRDITERQQVQRTLEEQTRALRETDRRKDEFLAMLAHELRNPLSSILNSVTLLCEEQSAENLLWAAEVIARQSGQLGRLVDDLLDVSRITRGKIELRKHLLDGANCIESACEVVATMLAERQHSLLASFGHQELWIEADPTRLEQIIVNLLANAAKYTEANGNIWLTAFRDRDMIVIEVRDSGVGIPPEQIPAMFELFAQGERTIARTEGGLGIGLTVVRGLCELHGGTVEAYSEGIGTGAKFTVRLPAAPEPEAVEPPLPIAGIDGASRSLRILVVDDNVDTAEGLARLLRRRGHEVALAYDGASALTVASSFDPEAVLLDIGLPGMTGYEVARALRSEQRGAASLIVALSGYGQEEDRRQSREAGFDEHLVKPVDFAAVYALLGERARTLGS